ncbi:PAS domain-containing protein [Paracoccus sp. (in: a-proteobacteria)]|uniref:PAS domain-containing protein n=1 Tax=Paracoccus sp. TaxID=267 RepID=UPI00396CD5DA
MPERDDGSEKDKGSLHDARQAKVLRLQDYEVHRPDRVLRELRDYWDSIRHGRAVPARSDVDPRGIAQALDFAFILERIAPGAGRIRLAGRHLIDLMGMEVRGMPICAFFQTASRGRLSDVLESVFKAPQIARIGLQSRAEYARPELQGQMLLLPLRSDLGDVTRTLGCIISHGDLGVAPRRFDLIDDEVMPIIEGGTTLAPSPSAMGFAEEGRTFVPKRRGRSASGQDKPLQGQEQAPLPSPPANTPEASTPEERRAMFRIIAPASDRPNTPV